MFKRDDVYRELSNAANPDPVARLKAVHEIGEILRAELDGAIDAAKLANVRAARRGSKPRSWREIGGALGVTSQHANRLYGDKL